MSDSDSDASSGSSSAVSEHANQNDPERVSLLNVFIKYHSINNVWISFLFLVVQHSSRDQYNVVRGVDEAKGADRCQSLQRDCIRKASSKFKYWLYTNVGFTIILLDPY